MAYEQFTKNLPPIIGLVVLVLVLLFVLVNFGYLRACDIPGFSGIYYSIKGKPNIAIVYGGDGSGDPEYLSNLIAQQIHVIPRPINASNIFDVSGLLSNYQIIIVEHSKTLSTQALWAFQKFVANGGKLVWIGDAGTGLTEDDNICEQVVIQYKPAVTQQTGPNTTQEVCAPQVEVQLNSPEDLGAGLCGKTFGDIVTAFVELNQSTYTEVATGVNRLCPGKGSYLVNGSGADKITKCIASLVSKGQEVSVESVDANCSGYNYWKRGPSKSDIKNTPAIDFSQTTLGIEFLKQYGASNLFLDTAGEHTLTRGYEVGTPFGEANVSLVDISRFAQIQRTSTIMSLNIGSKQYPAIIVSNPSISINRNGLIVYYAFAPDDLIKGGQGKTLINNLFSFLTC